MWWRIGEHGRNDNAEERSWLLPRQLAAMVGTLGLIVGWAIGPSAAAAAPAVHTVTATTADPLDGDVPPHDGRMVGIAPITRLGAPVLAITNSVGGRLSVVPTSDKMILTFAEFDPAGNRIAISTFAGLYLADAAGRHQTLVKGTEKYSYFRWNPVKPNELIASRHGKNPFVTVTLRESGPAILRPLDLPGAPPVGEARYSPDGKKILTGYDEHLRYFNADGSGGVTLKFKGYIYNPMWAPDSNSIIYSDLTKIYRRKLGSPTSTPLVGPAFEPQGYDARGRLLYSNLRTGNSLFRYDFATGTTTDLGYRPVYLDYYSAQRTAPGDLGSCDGLSATITGADGNDHIVGTAGDDIIRGLGGDDSINGMGGNDTICGGDGNDTLSGGTGNDRVFGDAGNDRIQGDLGNDRVGGGDGADHVDGGVGSDRVDGGTGRDVLLGGSGDDEVHGGDDNDSLNGGDGNDLMFGEGGADVIHGGNGNDVIQGHVHDGILEDSSDMLYGDAGNDNLSWARGPHATLWGGPGNDELYDGVTAYGESGNDRIDGASHVYGGDGDDELVARWDGGSVSGGAGNDKIWGRQYNDHLDGGAGKDWIQGSWGNDTIVGGDDADTIIGGDGNDVIDGSGGDDTIASGRGADTVHGGDGNDVISAFDQNDTVTGDAGDDRLTGGNGNDSLDGGSGYDRCDGSAGVDTGIRCEIRVNLEH